MAKIEIDIADEDALQEQVADLGIKVLDFKYVSYGTGCLAIMEAPYEVLEKWVLEDYWMGEEDASIMEAYIIEK